MPSSFPLGAIPGQQKAHNFSFARLKFKVHRRRSSRLSRFCLRQRLCDICPCPPICAKFSTQTQLPFSNHTQRVAGFLCAHRHTVERTGNFLAHELVGPCFPLGRTREAYGNSSLLFVAAFIAQMHFKDDTRNHRILDVSWEEGRPRSQPYTYWGVGLVLKVSHRIVPPVMNLFCSLDSLKFEVYKDRLHWLAIVGGIILLCLFV